MPDPAVLLANCVNPILTAFLVAAPLLAPPKSTRWEFWGRSLAALGLAVALAEGGKQIQIWPGHPGFPSGHETYGLCAVTCLTMRDVRWLFPGLPLLLLLAGALVEAHFHQPIDIAGAVLVGPPCALLFQWDKRRDKPAVLR